MYGNCDPYRVALTKKEAVAQLLQSNKARASARRFQRQRPCDLGSGHWTKNLTSHTMVYQPIKTMLFFDAIFFSAEREVFFFTCMWDKGSMIPIHVWEWMAGPSTSLGSSPLSDPAGRPVEVIGALTLEPTEEAGPDFGGSSAGLTPGAMCFQTMYDHVMWAKYDIYIHLFMIWGMVYNCRFIVVLPTLCFFLLGAIVSECFRQTRYRTLSTMCDHTCSAR